MPDPHEGLLSSFRIFGNPTTEAIRKAPRLLKN
jgi:hypothetical protein